MYQFLLESTGAEDAPTRACNCGPNEVCPVCSTSSNNTLMYDSGNHVLRVTNGGTVITSGSYNICVGNPHECECDCDYDESIEEDDEELVYTEEEFQEAVKEAMDKGWLAGYKEASDQLKQGTYREATKDGYDKGYDKGFKDGYAKGATDTHVHQDAERIARLIAKASDKSVYDSKPIIADKLDSQNSHDSAVNKLLNRYGKK